METEQLIDELEARGHAVVRCDEKGCGRPAAGSSSTGPKCEECLARVRKEALRRQYGCCATLIPANERIMAKRYRMTIEGAAPEEIEAWLVEKTGYDAAQWDRIEEYVHAGCRCTVWLVSGRKDGHVLGCRAHSMLVLARSGAEARKVWREHLYRSGARDIPSSCEARNVSGRPDLDPMVVSTFVEGALEYVLDGLS